MLRENSSWMELDGRLRGRPGGRAGIASRLSRVRPAQLDEETASGSGQSSYRAWRFAGLQARAPDYDALHAAGARVPPRPGRARSLRRAAPPSSLSLRGEKEIVRTCLDTRGLCVPGWMMQKCREALLCRHVTQLSLAKSACGWGSSPCPLMMIYGGGSGTDSQ